MKLAFAHDGFALPLVRLLNLALDYFLRSSACYDFDLVQLFLRETVYEAGANAMAVLPWYVPLAPFAVADFPRKTLLRRELQMRSNMSVNIMTV